MSYVCNYLHIVFSTKHRAKTISMQYREKLYSYITNIVKKQKSEMIRINGMEDHVHLLINLHSTVALADIVKHVKQSSSIFLREKCFNLFPMYEGWESEYYASSVSPAHVEKIKEYIINQENHHIGKEFKDEIKGFVGKMGMSLYEDL